MKILNLVYPKKSDISYKISKFPDGQQNITFEHVFEIIEKEVRTLKFSNPQIAANHPWMIKSRLNNWLDLELIVASVASLRGLGVKEIHLYTPYFMGARSDRKFEGGGNNYLKDVIAPVINSLNLESVTVLDPHSDVLEACINNFRKLGIADGTNSLVKWATREIYGVIDNGNYPFILVSPDAGAQKKIYKVAEQIGYTGDIITCSKSRDVDGKLTKTIVPNLDISKDLIIIDDICDGGATFINIAKEAAKQYPALKNPKIYLIVTHGIFSKQFKKLDKYFDGIYTTNSYKDFDLIQNEDDPFELDSEITKQLNVF